MKRLVGGNYERIKFMLILSPTKKEQISSPNINVTTNLQLYIFDSTREKEFRAYLEILMSLKRETSQTLKKLIIISC